jgi:hypothetical protein
MCNTLLQYCATIASTQCRRTVLAQYDRDLTLVTYSADPIHYTRYITLQLYY